MGNRNGSLGSGIGLEMWGMGMGQGIENDQDSGNE